MAYLIVLFPIKGRCVLKLKYCYTCNKYVPWSIKQEDITVTVRDKLVSYTATNEVCNICKSELPISHENDHCILDQAYKAYEKQYEEKIPAFYKNRVLMTDDPLKFYEGFAQWVIFLHNGCTEDILSNTDLVNELSLLIEDFNLGAIRKMTGE